MIRVEFLHVLVWILAKFGILIVLLWLELIFHSTIFGHHFGTRNLHVVNDKLIRKEGVLLVLTLEILYRNQHFLYAFNNLVLFIDPPIYDHLVRFILCEQFFLKSGQYIQVSRGIFSDTCRIHFISLAFCITNTEVAGTTISKQDVISNYGNFVFDNAIVVICISMCFVLAEFSVSGYV